MRLMLPTDLRWTVRGQRHTVTVDELVFGTIGPRTVVARGVIARKDGHEGVRRDGIIMPIGDLPGLVRTFTIEWLVKERINETSHDVTNERNGNGN